jgi:hypothetical protein
MPKSLRNITLSLLLGAILIPFFLYGCSYTPSTMPWTGIPPESLTQQQWQDILAVSREYQDHAETFKSLVISSVSTNVTGGSNPWQRSLNTSASGAKNLTKEQAQVTLNLSMIMQGMGQDSDEQSVTYDMYLKDKWLYINMTNVSMGSYWVKVKRSSELENKLNVNIAEKHLSPVYSPSNIEYLRTEQVNGVDCYVLSISPNKDALANWLDEQDTGFQNLDWHRLVNDTSTFQDFKLYCYLAKDSYFVMRISMSMIIEFAPDQAGADPSSFDMGQMSINLDMILYDFNVPYTVTLPEETFSANEVSSDIFLN